MKSYLVLENGQIFDGERIGFKKDVICEIVFNTSMTGYLEIFTDPSYSSQGVVMTYPLIGNYGLTLEDKESKKPWVEAVFIHELAEVESNFRSKLHLDKFLKYNKIPGLQGVNTRKLTKVLRDNGTMKGMLTDNISNINEIIEKIKNFKVTDIVKNVTSKEVYEIGEGSINLALLDFGSKQNIIKIQTIKEIYESDFNKPILGICLGHQLMGLATGAKTYKLKYGHRGPNHPVKNIEKDRIFITSQNHGYAIDEKTVNPDIAKVSDINMNDGTVEGLKYIKKDIYTVQFHPEACPGPEDNSYIFDEFLERIKKYAKK